MNVNPIASDPGILKMHVRKATRWFVCVQTPAYWDVVGAHLLAALAAGLPLLLSFIISHQTIPLLPCTFLGLTGYPCPFCGFTRSLWAISAGDWTYATINCPLAWPVYGALVLVFAWNAAGLLFGIKIMRGPALRLSSQQKRWALVLISVLVLLNWVYRLLMHLQ
jgi:hypothetical protein